MVHRIGTEYRVPLPDVRRETRAGLGNDDADMIDGARIFDVTASGRVSPGWRSDWEWAREISAFAGPAGRFFSAGTSLFSSNPEGLSRWSVEDGARTGHFQDFEPTHHHRGARELVSERDLTRLAIE